MSGSSFALVIPNPFEHQPSTLGVDQFLGSSEMANQTSYMHIVGSDRGPGLVPEVKLSRDSTPDFDDYTNILMI